MARRNIRFEFSRAQLRVCACVCVCVRVCYSAMTELILSSTLLQYTIGRGSRMLSPPGKLLRSSSRPRMQGWRKMMLLMVLSGDDRAEAMVAAEYDESRAEEATDEAWDRVDARLSGSGERAAAGRKKAARGAMAGWAAGLGEGL